ncbi:class I SAM-dependent methyltransferase [Lapillicoccus sp.]|uniref:class I SAM-dependent methyltransferase n=1 Tax=Lapillicoccus sp. TaxID=1909287 RepID=UPI0032665C4F
MAFDVPGDAYQQFMGIFSDPLSTELADLAGVRAGSGMRVLDVGCGPGALTSELVNRCGAAQVVGVDPSPPFVAAVRARLAGVDVVQAPAEELPFEDESFDATLAQLVVHFMGDPAGGVGQMRRVTRPGGVVAACVWDFAGGRAPLSKFWRAVASLDPGVTGEQVRTGSKTGDLVALFRAAGLTDVRESELTVTCRFASFEEWWHPYTLGVGPAGDQVRSLDNEGRVALREACRELIPEPPFVVQAVAWAAVGTR